MANLIWAEIFSDYKEALRESTEACSEFHLFCILTIIGALLNRRVATPYGRLLYPNFFTVLVGESAISRKTTAQRFAMELLEKSTEDINILGSLSSAEGLLRQLGAYCPDEDDPKESKCTIVSVEEFSSLLRKSRQESVSNILPMLTEIYDLPSRLTLPRIRRPLRVDKPFLCILSGTTPDWLESSIKEEEIAGGFCNRFLYCMGLPGEPIPSPKQPKEFIIRRIADKLRETKDYWVSKGSTILELSAPAEKVWENYYKAWREITSARMTQTLVERVPEYARKIALIISALERESEISLASMNLGVEIATYAEDSLRKVFSAISLGGPVDKCEKRILRILAERNPIRRRDLQMSCGPYASAEIFRRALSALAWAQRIAETEDQGAWWVRQLK